MTRIFDALKKVQAAAPAVAPPAIHTTPPRHARVGGAAAAPARPALHASAPAAPAAAHPAEEWSPAPGPIAAPIEAVEVRELPTELVRELTTLRIGIEAAVDEGATRAILFLSPQGGEGTSTVAAEFAALLASDRGARPLLVDAHARRPSLAARFGLGDSGHVRRPGIGVAPMLSVMAVPPDVARRGMFPPAMLRDLLVSAAGAWDWVIIDGPPVLEAPEATELALLATGVVLVLEAGSTKRHVVIRAVDLLRKVGARVLGSVLNRRRLEIPDFIYRRI